MRRRLVWRIKEAFELLKLMRPLAKIRIGLLGIYGFIALFIMGWLFHKICLTYILLSIAAIIVYIIIIILEALSQ